MIAIRCCVVCCALLTMGSVVNRADPPNSSSEPECREHLQTLGNALGLYLIHNDRKLPARISELYTGGYVLDLEVFVCPASHKQIASEKQIDELSDYEMTTQLGTSRPLLLLKEKSSSHDGAALYFYSDRTIRKVAGSPRTEPPSPSTTNPGKPTAPNAATAGKPGAGAGTSPGPSPAKATMPKPVAGQTAKAGSTTAARKTATGKGTPTKTTIPPAKSGGPAAGKSTPPVPKDPAPPEDSISWVVSQSFGTYLAVRNGKLSLTEVEGGSPGDRAGLGTGDIIVNVNDKTTTGLSGKDLQALVFAEMKSPLLLEFVRSSDNVRVVVTITGESGKYIPAVTFRMP